LFLGLIAVVLANQLCKDEPTAAIEGGKIFIEQTISFNDKSRIYWAIR
jgi:hypothetical protein